MFAYTCEQCKKRMLFSQEWYPENLIITEKESGACICGACQRRQKERKKRSVSENNDDVEQEPA